MAKKTPAARARARTRKQLLATRTPGKSSATNSGGSLTRALAAEAALGPYAEVGRDVASLLGFGDLGARVGGAIGRLFGKGDYEVKSNSLMSAYGKPAAGPPPPLAFRDGKRGVRVVEREYLCDIQSGLLDGASTGFSRYSYPINPALPLSFPWLSQIAIQFDQWEPNGIVYEFRSTSSEFNGTSQALGVVVMATDYDSLDTPYATKVEMENSDYAMSVKSSDTAIHGVECSLAERPTPVLYTRSGTPPTGSDRRMYDLGNFQLATQGVSAAGVTLGELWVSYDITFYKKQLTGGVLGNDIFYGYCYALNCSNSDYFGVGDASARFWGTFDLSAYLGANTIRLPAGMTGFRFYTAWFTRCDNTASTVTFTPNDDVLESNPFVGDPATYQWNNASGSNQGTYLIWEVLGDNPVITLSGGSVGTGGTVSLLYIGQVPSNDVSGQPAM